MEEDIKSEDKDRGVKEDIRKLNVRCPFCGNMIRLKVIGKYIFCNKCHTRMPWTVREMEDTPVKQEN